MHKGVLVDTCIFVDFLRSKGSKNDKFKELIEQERVVLSPFVRLEILKGVKIDQYKKLNILLNGFVTISKGSDVIELAEVHLLKARKGGVNFGLIDYFIVLEALKFKLNIFSRDKLILELAKNLGVRTLAD